MSSRFFITLPNPSAARGDDPDLASQAHGADAFAMELQNALRSPALFERWRDKQDDSDNIDPRLGEVDPTATVRGSQSDLAIDLVVETSLSGTILQQRMRWLVGSAWQMRDVEKV